MMNKKCIEELKEYVWDDTKSVELMDKFEGIDSNIIYERLVIKNSSYGVTKAGEFYSYHLVIERGWNEKEVGDITFTEFKKGNDSDLVQHIENEITPQVLKKYKGKNKIYYFSKPYVLRAQNSSNRVGYGSYWDRSGNYYKGTEYGETSNYLFVGVYID